jgi:hypothetical protein
MDEKDRSAREFSEYDEEMERYQAFLDHRKLLHDALLQVTGRFTQWSITLAGGALALSMTYVEKINPEVSGGRCFLVTAWLALGVSLIASLASLYYSTEATQKAILDHDEDYRKWLADKSAQQSTVRNGFTMATKWLAVISMWSFGIGVVLLAAFVACCPPSNQKQKQDNAKTDTTTPATATKATTSGPKP